MRQSTARLEISLISGSSERTDIIVNGIESTGWHVTQFRSDRELASDTRSFDLVIVVVDQFTNDLHDSILSLSDPARRPIIVIGRQPDPEIVAAALRSGADDYMAEPYALEELLARIESLVLRTRGIAERRQNPLIIDIPKRTIVAGRQQVEFPENEWAVLTTLLEKNGSTAEFIELGDHVANQKTKKATVISTIARLRRRLKNSDFSAFDIESVDEKGYRVRFRRARDSYNRMLKQS